MGVLKSFAKGMGMGVVYSVGIMSAAILVGAGVALGIKAGESINDALYTEEIVIVNDDNA